MLGLGDEEHNRRVREMRENRRKARTVRYSEMELWNIWQFYIAACEQQGQQNSSPSHQIYATSKERGVNENEKLFNELKADLIEGDVTDIQDSSF